MGVGPIASGGSGGSVPAASTTVAGKVELATNAEAITGTDTARAVTPAALAAALLATGGGADIVQYPAGGPWPSRPDTDGDVLWISADPTAGNPSGALPGDAVVLPQLEVLTFALSDETTAITSGTAKLTVRWPYAFTVTAVRANLNTVSSSGTVQVDINEGGASILSTKLTIDASEKTSTTAATAAVISDTTIADDAEVTFDIDGAGTGAKGLKVHVYGYR